MAQAWTAAEEKLLKEDPLHDVKDDLEHNSPRLKHVELPEGYVPAGGDAQMEDVGVVKSHVPAAFLDELQNDHTMNEPAQDLGGSEAEFMADDPLHNVKQELEHHSPRLRHVDSPYSPGHQSPLADAGGAVKSEVPPAFEEELRNDHDIVKDATEGGNATTGADPQAIHNVEFLSSNVRDAQVPRGRPRFRISANVGNRPRGPAVDPETAGICVKDDDADGEVEGADGGGKESSSTTTTTTPEDETVTKVIGSGGIPARGTPYYRISAHQGMRPGGPLSRDFKAETASESNTAGGGEGGDLSSGDVIPKGPGLRSRGGLSNAGSRRGGLARTGSGVPGDQRGSLARTGSGVPGNQRGSLARSGSEVPGNSLARQGSGAFGGSLARTRSGVPSSRGGNDLKDFSSFLDTTADLKEETESPVGSEEKGVLGKIGEKWSQINSYGTGKEGEELPKELEEKVTGENVSAIDIESKAL